MKIGIEHIAIYAKDTKKLSDWYKNLFDGEIVYDNKKVHILLHFPTKV